MQPQHALATLPPALAAVRARVDAALDSFLEEQRAELESIDADAVLLVEELMRLVHAGGKRLRPAFCYWGYRAAGGADADTIVRAAAALELLHTFALIHDDLMDGTPERRGVPSSHVHLAAEAGRLGVSGEPARFGLSAAVLVGDLAMVFADRMLRESGFAAERLEAAGRRYDLMRRDMAVGQLLDVSGPGAGGESRARLVASLKTGSYTVQGPLEIGAILANGSGWSLTCLSRYGQPLGEAFQVLDDLRDSEADQGARERADALVTRAKASLDPAALSPEAVGVLRMLADLIARG
ncbi:MAG TPA: polyprenyl synthetase family protein [Actinomycetota bacterium]|nr:polyprenyl synthetase family protein [Actinomycetota bacterium]